MSRDNLILQPMGGKAELWTHKRKGPRFSMHIGHNDREEFLAEARLYLPEFVKAEKQVSELKGQIQKLKTELRAAKISKKS